MALVANSSKGGPKSKATARATTAIACNRQRPKKQGAAKLAANDDEDCKESANRVRILYPKTVIWRPPSSNEASISSRLSHLFPTLHPHSEWLELVPCRLGSSKHVDQAALAFIEAFEFQTSHRTDAQLSLRAHSHYGRAVNGLKHALNTSENCLSDFNLLCVALLTLCEITMQPWSSARRTGVFSHWSGLGSLFLARAPSIEISDISRAVLYGLWDTSFGVPVAQGTPSPFETDFWLNLDPASIHPEVTDADKLRKLCNRALIQVPRLIKYVRALRTSPHAVGANTDSVVLAGKMLVSIKDDHIESKILHRVNLKPTEDEAIRDMIPFSYEFDDPREANAAVLYWSCRMMIINLCLKIIETVPSLMVPFDIDQLMKEKERCFINNVMSWQYAMSVGPFATVWLSKGLLQQWQYLRSTETFRGRPTKDILQWMLAKINHESMEWMAGTSTEEDLDVAADLLMGGPIDGFIADAARK